MTKRCSYCDTEKILSEFNRRSNGAGYKSKCRICENITRQTYTVRYNRSTEKAKKSAKNSILKQKYRITIEDFERLQSKQYDACRICARKDLQLVVDHDHKTGIIRGLLCHNCNRGLGVFFENPALLRQAANHLEDHANIQPRIIL